jgi:hypothetical protein
MMRWILGRSSRSRGGLPSFVHGARKLVQSKVFRSARSDWVCGAVRHAVRRIIPPKVSPPACFLRQ